MDNLLCMSTHVALLRGIYSIAQHRKHSKMLDGPCVQDDRTRRSCGNAELNSAARLTT